MFLLLDYHPLMMNSILFYRKKRLFRWYYYNLFIGDNLRIIYSHTFYIDKKHLRLAHDSGSCVAEVFSGTKKIT